MKRYCGIELKGNDAVLVVLEDNNIITTNVKKISISDSKNQDSIRAFNKEIVSFFTKYSIDNIGIKERATKGRFAGGSVSFKMESLIQNTAFDVVLIHNKTINSKLKSVDLDYSDMMKYQEGAFQVACYLSIS